MLAILLASDVKTLLDEVAVSLSEKLKQELDIFYQIIGPADATIGKINDIYRKIIYIRHDEYNKLTEVKDLTEALMEQKKKEWSRCCVYFDFDPMNGY